MILKFNLKPKGKYYWGNRKQVRGAGFRVQGSGFRVQGSRFKMKGARCGASPSA
jgi:hypothetical protein